MDDPKLTVKLDVEDIGPHSGSKVLHIDEKMDSLKAIFYASNGTGKSFISRTIRLLAPEKDGATADEMITLGKTSGSLKLHIVNSDTPTDEKKLSVRVQSGSVPAINNESGYVYHVFNSEYVEDNIKPRDYTPDGKIDGYILGKVQIDLTEEKKQKKLLEDEIDEKGKAIDTIVSDAKNELQSNGIRANQSEFGLITKERLRKPENVTCDRSFDEVVTQLKVLEDLPDSIPDIPALSFQEDVSVFDEITTLLTTAYPKSDWDEEFALQVKAKRAFVEKGLEFSADGDVCPFCGQEYGNTALELIRKYKAFLNDKEIQVLREIDRLTAKSTAIINTIKELGNKIQISNAKIGELKQYFPSLRDTELSTLDVSDEVVACFRSIDEALKQKASDIPETTFDVDTAITSCKGMVDTATKVCGKNNGTINSVNTQKNNSNNERLILRRKLCIAQYLRKRTQLEADFNTISTQAEALEALKESIAQKEEQARKSKRTEVFNTLDYFLNRFFAGKYTIDKDTFLIKFQNMTHEKASSILSDGEKSIVAFCFYLASTHLLMSREDDYDRLFFIIDDPISSMDFHFVYAVAQSLRDIKEYFRINRHSRIFVFTHNLEFYSIVTRNHTITNAYVMTPGKVERLKSQMLMPYENHLQDIVKVANGQDTPTHTIGNSIRHVLETVSKFEYPEKKLETYISENDTLAKNSCVFSLCQDLSHGAVRQQPPFDEQVISEACKVVVEFMTERYKGQIDSIGK